MTFKITRGTTIASNNDKTNNTSHTNTNTDNTLGQDYIRELRVTGAMLYYYTFLEHQKYISSTISYQYQ